MTALQEQAISMIKRAPDEEVTYVIGILHRHERKGESNENKSLERSRAAFRKLMSFCKKSASPKDYKEDLAEALDEKYESVS